MKTARVVLCVLLAGVLLRPLGAQTVQERVQILILRYIDQRDAEKYTDALETMLKARDLQPNNAEVWAFLGEVYRNLARRIEAIQALRKALELGSTDEWDRDTLVSLLQEEADDRRNQDRLDDAERLLLEAHRLAPADPQPLVSLGVLRQFDRDDQEAAVRYYQQALAVNPGHVAARGNLAGVLNRLGRHAECERLCRAGLATGELEDWDRDWLRGSLVKALVGQEKYEEAEKEDDQIATPQHRGRFAEALCIRAGEELRQGKADSALELLRRAAQRPYFVVPFPIILALALQMRGPAEDPEALEQQAEAIVGAGAPAAATGACLSLGRWAREGDRIYRVYANFGEVQLRVLSDYEKRALPSWGEYPDRMGCAEARSRWLAFDFYSLGAETPAFEPRAVLANDLGVSVKDVPVVATVAGDDFAFPPADEQGRRLLDPEARRLTLIVSAAEGPELRFEWVLPLRESRLAQAGWEALTPERRQWLEFFSRQEVLDAPRRLRLCRLVGEYVLKDITEEEAREAARRLWNRHEVVEASLLASTPAAGARRLCLLGSHGEQVPGRVPSDQEMETLFGEGGFAYPWDRPAPEPVKTEEGTLVTTVVLFPLTSGGRPVLEEDDRAIRIGLLDADRKTVAATYEFPRRPEDVSAD